MQTPMHSTHLTGNRCRCYQLCIQRHDNTQAGRKAASAVAAQARSLEPAETGRNGTRRSGASDSYPDYYRLLPLLLLLRLQLLPLYED